MVAKGDEQVRVVEGESVLDVKIDRMELIVGTDFDSLLRGRHESWEEIDVGGEGNLGYSSNSVVHDVRQEALEFVQAWKKG